jgi:hypothetical protein
MEFSLLKDQFGNLAISGFSGNGGSEDFTTLKYQTNYFSVNLMNFNGDSLCVNSSSASYQWYKDNVLLANETLRGINILPYGNGNYYCEVTQYCSTYYTDTFPAFSVSLPENDKVSKPFGMTFNPQSNVIEIIFHSFVAEVLIEVYDMTGKCIAEKKANNIDDEQKVELSFSDQSASVYFINVIADGCTSRLKFQAITN